MSKTFLNGVQFVAAYPAAGSGSVAGQAAYGVVGCFEKAPVEPVQFVLMDFRCDHLREEQRLEQRLALAAVDGCDAAPVCNFPLGCKAWGR